MRDLPLHPTVMTQSFGCPQKRSQLFINVRRDESDCIYVPAQIGLTGSVTVRKYIRCICPVAGSIDESFSQNQGHFTIG